MRNFILVVIVVIISLNIAKADSLLDSDYNFINSAFDGIKPVTNKEFNDTINKLTPKPIENTFKGKLKAFLFGREYGIDTPPLTEKEKQTDVTTDAQAIKDLTSGIYYIKLVAPIISSSGKVIPVGNYKIKEQKIDDQSYLAFFQGHNEYGKLKLKKYDDSLKSNNEIAYSRVDIVSDDIIRIVYSTIDDTKCAIAKVYLQN